MAEVGRWKPYTQRPRTGPAACPERPRRYSRVPRMPRWLRQPRHAGGAWYCPFTLASGSDPRHESRVALLEVREPGAVALLAPANHGEEEVLQAARDRSRRAVADAPVVELADRRHLGRRAGEERLVRQVDLVAREALLARRETQVGEQPEDRVSGDAAEHGRERRRLHRPLAHDEDVLSARLGDVAVDVEEERLVVARVARLARGEDRVHVVAGRLRLGEQRVRMEAREGARLDPDAVLHPLVTQVGAPRPGGDGDARRGARREPHLAVAHEDDGAEVALAEPVGAHRLEAGVDQALARVRHRQLEDVRRAVATVDGLVQAEDRRAAVVALVAADALEDPEPVVQRVGEHVDLGGLPGHELAVEPDALGLLHREQVTRSRRRRQTNAGYRAPLAK